MNNSEHDPPEPDHGNDSPAEDDVPSRGKSGDGQRDGAGDQDGDGQQDEAGDRRPSEDEVWQDLVSRLEHTDSGPDPDGTDRDPDGTEPRGRSASPAPGPVVSSDRRPEPSRREGPQHEHLGGPRDYTPEEEDDTFVPEEPPSSLAGTEPLVVLAWVGAVGGPLALLLSAFFWRSMPMLAVIGIVAAFLVSVVFLLMRLPSDRGDDHDDGAIV